MSSARDIFLALRPTQWPKNAVVGAALFFAFADKAQDISLVGGLARVIPAILLFCTVSSGIYVLNDVRDVDADRLHPTKKFRPIAAGRVTLGTAWLLGTVLLLGGLGLALLLCPGYAGVAGTYVVLQLVYSFGLKKVALLDVFVIASGFVLRASAGAVVLSVTISPWLLLCTFLLALFLALCKRRHECILLADAGVKSRESLGSYDERLLDQLISMTAGATVVAYAIYTMSPQTIEKFGTAKLGFTVPFVIFGIFRYLDLAYRHDKGDRPEKILLSDAPTLVNLALYGICAIAIFLLRP